MSEHSRSGEKILRGIPVSGGVCRGKIVVLGEARDAIPRHEISEADVAQEIQRFEHALGRTGESALHRLSEHSSIISVDLSPSTTALLDKKMVLGFATDSGSKTSHTAIMARSLQIPAVVGLQDASKQLKTGQDVLLDGYNGLLVVSPTDQTLFEYGQLVRKQVNLQEKLQDIRDKPAITLDGVRIVLSANVEQAADAEHVRACGAEAVGLLRTGYLYPTR